ncbi:P43 5S RNA-binding protein-like [Sinocyclocheilus rhinocerous]|uniref:P43 5S RNA-binding protein-like n=1 Tax=Sinocyclocheilus rhinocerous TaxID=307959 RepID=UPI0007B85328|nr:PREDICTED: P43 5S RNA-binding protein-like [Sinocyclocheilus rhinocerous]
MMNARVVEKEDAVPRLQLFNCAYTDCGATFVRQWRLLEHETVHTGARPHKCVVAGCGRSFTRKSHLSRHALIHSGVKDLKCSAAACGKSFFTADKLKRHVRYAHSEKREYFKCEEPKCAKTFRKRRALKLHLATHGTSSFRCLKSGCGMRFESHVARKAHDRRHSDFNSLVICVKHPHKRSSKSWQKRLEGRNRRPLVEDLRSLFSLRMKISPRAKLEADLTGLFNERKIPHHVDPEVNLRDLFSIRPTKVADK